ncbi:hypothetical protein DXZ20_25740 [Leptolyngbyaceae cyanobacterium CCMR0081]|uniref:Uncharacterized protein n=2 Tax=Adonisia TaxID=2950183 RepID=A0A6M0RTF7_9CYAN|nr:hypothetical protein [Adonisia turfae CCMR0081]
MPPNKFVVAEDRQQQKSLLPSLCLFRIMLPITIERILHAIALTSLVSSFAPVAVAQPSTNLVDAVPEEIALDLRSPDVRNGTYLFSSDLQPTSSDSLADSSESATVEYMVLQLEENQVVGGFYQPLSEYSCFTGTVHGESLDLWVSPPSTTEVYPYSILTQLQPTIAGHPEATGLAPYELELRDAHRLSTLDQVSQNVLNACLIELSVR